MKVIKILGTLLLGVVAAAVSAQSVDFLHMPRHTVELTASNLVGRPDTIRLNGYYLFKEGDRIVFMSHRPEEFRNVFFGNAILDRGLFDDINIVSRTRRDRIDGRGVRLSWDLQTGRHFMNGISFRLEGARYLVLDVRQDQTGGALPAIFVGRNEQKYKSGSGYVLIDLMK